MNCNSTLYISHILREVFNLIEINSSPVKTYRWQSVDFFSIMSEFLCENDGPKPPWGYTTLIINFMYIICHRRSVYWDNNFAKDWDNIEPTKSGM